MSSYVIISDDLSVNIPKILVTRKQEIGMTHVYSCTVWPNPPVTTEVLGHDGALVSALFISIPRLFTGCCVGMYCILARCLRSDLAV